jgi:two-component system, NarL family, response regulator NreC
MQRKTRILLVDDHAVVRSGFRLIINQHSDLEVVGEAGTGTDGVKQTLNLRPDIVILDVGLPDISGVEATRRIIESCPDCRVLILSMHRDSVYVRETLRAGAKGYLLKDSIDEDLLKAIRAVARGEGFLSPAVSRTVLDDYQQHMTDPLDLLTAREREILQLLAEGLTAKEIASRLDLSVYTVDAHRGRILKKLNVHTGGDLIRFAMRKGLIQ